jgi:Tannase-like family of unknown function (DUF6351)
VRARKRFQSRFILAISILLLASLGAAGQNLEIRTVSTRPDMVSGQDTLVRIDLPLKVSAPAVAADLDGRDITNDFRRIGTTGSLLGLVKDLTPGKHTLTARVVDGSMPSITATLELVDHPITGPIFSGPHQSPFICETDRFTLPDGMVLGPPLDENCSAMTRVNYVYKSTNGGFKPLADVSIQPADLARTTTSKGRTVPYIVRVETGTINRAIYQILILYDPASDPAPNPFTRPAGWNGNLIFTSAGGLSPGYHQGVINLLLMATGSIATGTNETTGNSVDPYEKYQTATSNMGPPNDAWLSLGFAYAQSTLNSNNANDNTVLSAETAMMIKEHFIDEFGPVRFTIGTGISGGSMQTNDVAQAYPGIFDGIVSSGFADNITTIHNHIECALLDRAFKTANVTFTRDQMQAVSGWGDWRGCEEWMDIRKFTSGTQLQVPVPQIYSQILPTAARGKTMCSPIIPPELMYDPVKNPKGSRCTYQDNSINIFGRDPKTGFARRPFDNIGVQYGLVAFNAGKISAEQFVQLNELVGGYDMDGNFIPDRYSADPEALRIAYVSGRINSGAGAASIPVILEAWPSAPRDFRNGRVSEFSVRERMIATNGDADNVVLVTSPPLDGPGRPLAGGALYMKQMDQWLENLAKDPSPMSHEKFVRTKPADLTDGCYKADGTKIKERADYENPSAVCNQLYPVYGTPRIATGAPITDDVLKCQLRTLNPKDYVQPLTADQIRRLNVVFSRGVCDYSRPGIGQQPVKFWLSYPVGPGIVTEPAHARN